LNKNFAQKFFVLDKAAARLNLKREFENFYEIQKVDFFNACFGSRVGFVRLQKCRDRAPEAEPRPRHALADNIRPPRKLGGRHTGHD